MEAIVNKVATSGLVSIDLEELIATETWAEYDLLPQLFMGQILKEKDFRDFVKNHDWSVYTGKNVAIYCSVDAIVPTWAYMLLAIALQPFAASYVFGHLETLKAKVLETKINELDLELFAHKKCVIKGCSKEGVPTAAYVAITNRLLPVVQSLMFGEPCSTVPLYKRKKVE